MDKKAKGLIGRRPDALLGNDAAVPVFSSCSNGGSVLLRYCRTKIESLGGDAAGIFQYGVHMLEGLGHGEGVEVASALLAIF